MCPNSSIPNSSVQTSQRRKSTGKRLRFEIFKRDGFACQYCGAQPPDVVLVVDHIHPVAKGGDNDPLNLITACEPCNQGKADKTLGDRIVRPDADLLYLETQQESAEIERYIAALEHKSKLHEQLVDALIQQWFVYDEAASYAPGWLPRAIRTCLKRYDPETVESAIADVASKCATGYVTRSVPTDRYFYAVARNMAAADEDDN